MTAISEHPIFRTALWRTISAIETGQGYSVYEAPDRFWRERMAEAVLRVAGVSLIFASSAPWFVPDAMLRGDPVLARTALAVVFTLTGIALYFFASRGFRKEVRFDADARQIGLCRLNANDRCLVSRQVPLDRIESLIVARATAGRPLAALNLRQKGSPHSICIMRGAQSEIGELHRQLCRDIQVALTLSAPLPRASGTGQVAAAVRRVSALRAESPVRRGMATARRYAAR